MNKLLLVVIIAIMGITCSPKLSPDSNWGYQRWVLVEMKEVPVQQSGGSRDAYVEFFPSEKRFSGNGGCNRISGNYTLDKKNEIQFQEVTSTKMSCPDIAFETTFLATLNEVNRFDSRDGNMILKNDRKTLLVFERRSIPR